jgi:hypothetical protein
MSDYTYPSVFLAYLLFFLCLAGAIFFLIRSRHDGYWGRESEEPKYRMLAEDESGNSNGNSNDADSKTD